MEWRWREGSKRAGVSVRTSGIFNESDKLFDGDPGFAKNGAERPPHEGLCGLE